MNPALLTLPAAFGLAAATGLNISAPLTIIGFMARFGFLKLAPPFDALASDLALAGLVVLVLLETVADKVPGLDSLAHGVLWPLSVAAGGIAFASMQSGAVES